MVADGRGTTWLSTVSDLGQLLAFAQSLAVGLLIGLDRERQSGNKAGLRTFALIALCGTVLAQLAGEHVIPWLLPSGLLTIGLTLIAAHAGEVRAQADPGTTTVVSALLTFALGAMIGYGHARSAIAAAVGTTLLLHLREQLHGASRRMSETELTAILQFGVLAFVLLPVLPNEALGGYEALNPYRIAFFATFVSALSLCGYLGLRWLGARRGRIALGVLGGLVSTTATTLLYSRQARRDPAREAFATSVIVIANLALFARIGAVGLVVAPASIGILGPILLGGALVGGAYAMWCVRRCESGESAAILDVRNPAELQAALGFAAVFAGVSFLVALLRAQFGAAGVYAAAGVAGLADLDAISISSLQLSKTGSLAMSEAIGAIVIAYLANLLTKSAIAVGVGTRYVGIHVGGGFASGALGMLGAWALLRWRWSGLP